MVSSYKAASDIDVLTSSFPIPGFGHRADQRVRHQGPGADPGRHRTVVEREEFMAALRSVIDPAELRWIWLTHTDFDHIGACDQLLAENPQLRVITTFLGVGIMSLTAAPLPMDRVYLVNPGQTITLGDRTLTAVKPPAFDNPSTTGFYDDEVRRVVQLRLLRSAAFGRAPERRRPLGGRAAGRADLLGDASTRRGCTRSTVVRSRGSSTASARSSRRWS